jgi:uncharacterized protein YecE (DUF72 family)
LGQGLNSPFIRLLGVISYPWRLPLVNLGSPAVESSVIESLMNKIYIGTAGFSYPDWRGVVYPANVKKLFGHELVYLARYFDLCEINTSFYGPLKPKDAIAWCGHVTGVNPDFQFTAKLTRVFTHAANANTTSTSVDTIQYTPKDIADAKAGFDPLMAAGRLGAIVVQFPISFKLKDKQKNGDAEPLHGNWDHVLDLLNIFKDYPLAVEFRDATWDDAWVIKELQERNVAFCNVDQPRLGNSLDGTDYVTASFAYLRLHGRNYKTWFTSKNRDDRYDFLYDGERLERVEKRAAEMSKKAKKTFVVANNHPKGQAPANALQLKQMLSGKKVKAPRSLVEYYRPQLEDIVESE